MGLRQPRPQMVTTYTAFLTRNTHSPLPLPLSVFPFLSLSLSFPSRDSSCLWQSGRGTDSARPTRRLWAEEAVRSALHSLLPSGAVVFPRSIAVDKQGELVAGSRGLWPRIQCCPHFEHFFFCDMYACEISFLCLHS